MKRTQQDEKWTEASKREATADELVVLSYTHDAAVRAAVAGHPNTPAFLLARLAPEFPCEVLGNPALPLLRLAQPQLLSRWPREALLALLGLPDPPEWLRRQARASAHVEVQVALAELPSLSRSEIAALAQHPAWLVRARIAARADLPAELLRDLTRDTAYGVRLALAYRPDLPPSSAEQLRHDPSRFVRQVLERSGQQRASSHQQT